MACSFAAVFCSKRQLLSIPINAILPMYYMHANGIGRAAASQLPPFSPTPTDRITSTLEAPSCLENYRNILKMHANSARITSLAPNLGYNEKTLLLQDQV
jgi:hypothetical protein